jgi:hypothetical protein
VIIIDDDDDEEKTERPDPPKKQKALPRQQSSANEVSNARPVLTPGAPSPRNAMAELNGLQKCRLCIMWRNKKSFPDIARALNVSEAILQAYIYDLIKQDAMNSNPAVGVRKEPK